jgi:hypothetical protein
VTGGNTIARLEASVPAGRLIRINWSQNLKTAMPVLDVMRFAVMLGNSAESALLKDRGYLRSIIVLCTQ